jgi:hypothetical protein
MLDAVLVMLPWGAFIVALMLLSYWVENARLAEKGTRQRRVQDSVTMLLAASVAASLVWIGAFYF